MFTQLRPENQTSGLWASTCALATGVHGSAAEQSQKESEDPSPPHVQ